MPLAVPLAVPVAVPLRAHDPAVPYMSRELVELENPLRTHSSPTHMEESRVALGGLKTCPAEHSLLPSYQYHEGQAGRPEAGMD